MDRRNNQASSGLLADFHEDLVYIIECLSMDYTGEAKGELAELISKISAVAHIDNVYCQVLTSSLKGIRAELVQNSRSAAALTDLVTLRRRVAHTKWQLDGRHPRYGYAEPLAPLGE